MPMITADDGARLNVKVEGPDNAPVLMLSNSLGTDLAMWDVQAPEFSRHFRLVRYDRRGHGKSDAPKGPYSMQRLGRDVIAILDALKIKKTNWCGLSMGGMVGMWLAANAPGRVDRIVLSNTACRYPNGDLWNDRIRTVSEKGTAAIVNGSMERWFTQGYRERAPDKVKPFHKQFLKTNAGGYVACCQAIRDMDQSESIRGITAPTLIIAGSQDAATTPRDAEYIQARIKGSELKMLDAAHISNVEQSEAYTATVLKHLHG
ncbi:3-oxoadipate enol-lactonase 2 [Variibacter gotjawalensis]|uniref:3-oxoadipate enol-lactonase 2 n=1 Tax=Variibacter gotjawalensis TaxID=1333996 RepID=A0A0S3PWD5_9BRAD|nr:3-oxoadipate enol-lactonase [Variibacter gotjawalensis]NIK45922.1 3-oxoadipate enol-lactonase [Variibacter gotjawalensis]RZS47842.1 3-oxoadipate enol-lactonase [Variibacter gotjawalensis]BAT60096.1 3-oxoadipate enol-lactonase 2 [Variibacter gotjawalensis]